MQAGAHLRLDAARRARRRRSTPCRARPWLMRRMRAIEQAGLGGVAHAGTPFRRADDNPRADRLGGGVRLLANASGSAGSRSSATMPGPATHRRSAVQPGAGAGGLPGRHALGQQPGDDPGQHVAGAGGGEPGRRRGVDRGASVRRGDDRVGPFSSTTAPVRAAAARAAAAGLRPGRPNTRANSPACGVSTAAPRKASGLPAKAEKRVGVGHHACARRRSAAAGRPRARLGAEARAADPDMAAGVCQQRPASGASLTSRPGEPAR